MKFLKVVCVIALVFAVSAIAYAETQSVKVSGDIAARAFARDNYDLSAGAVAPPAIGGVSSNWATFLQSTVEVQVDADLTDNVSGVIRLVNQRVWGDELYQSTGIETVGLGAARDTNVARAVAPGADAYQVSVDLAYIELKEFLYSPLTLRIGRQDLWFGKGFIVGNSLQDPTGALYAREYTAITSFDAIRATLDYDPWTIDAVYAKISENWRKADDDENLFGVNVGYIFDEYNAEAEAYWWLRQDRNPGGTGAIVPNQLASLNGNISNDVNTWGVRGSFDPIENWTVALEGALQNGSFLGIAAQMNRVSRLAWAVDAMIECRVFQDEYAWKPVLMAEYILYSGGRDIGNRDTSLGGPYRGWDPMYRGKFDTAIREFQNVFYGTAQYSTPATTNQHQAIFGGTIEPTDSVTIEGKMAYFWLDRAVTEQDGNVNNQFSNKYLGTEFDCNVTWDYTEDVTFGLLSGFFFPGSHWSKGAGFKNIATDIVGTVKLSF